MRTDHHPAPGPQLVVRGTVFGGHCTAIIVPLTGANADAVLGGASVAVAAGADALEWRADLLADGTSLSELAVRLRETIDAAGGEGIPLLVTVRTAQEGGALDLDDGAYTALLAELLDAGGADMVDVECLREPKVVRALMRRAHTAGIAVIGSSHDFSRTPPAGEITARLARMRDLGADIAKIAVTPKDPGDVLTLLHATWDARQLPGMVPLITISMGDLGTITRLGGGLFGSVATFASAGETSAPGQLDAGRVRDALRTLRRSAR